MVARFIALARAPVEPAEAGVAVGDERAHPELLGERKSVTLAHVPAKWTRFADEEHAPHMNLERIHALTCREAVQHQRDAL